MSCLVVILIVFAIMFFISNPIVGLIVLVVVGGMIWFVSRRQGKIRKENFERNFTISQKVFKGFNSIKSRTVGDYTFLISEGYDELGIKYHSNERIEGATRIEIKKLTNIEILQDDVTIREGGIGRAVVGGILAGGAGAVVGANTAKQTKKVEKITLKFTFKDIDNPIYRVDVYCESRDRLTLQWKNVLNQADELIAIFGTIRTDINDKNKLSNQAQEFQQIGESDDNQDFEQKLLKLASLRDSNIITQEEFEQKKRQIIDRL